ncbi:MAG: hypothetical protein ACOY94_18465 [Bacillota bacterium]
MRNEGNGFLTGMMTGAALGALVVMAMTPQVRQPVMQGMGAVGNRMRRMMRRGNMTNMVDAMMPGDAD